MTTALTTDIRDGIAVITLDVPGAPVNTFARSVREEFASMLETLERDQSIRAAVVRSGKPDVWVAGADIEEFLEIETASQAEAMSRDGHALLERLEKLRTPVVAAINGACLGGGLEAALACAYRVATDAPKTVFGLPEVQIGLIPGAGGTQRWARVCGRFRAAVSAGRAAAMRSGAAGAREVRSGDIHERWRTPVCEDVTVLPTGPARALRPIRRSSTSAIME